MLNKKSRFILTVSGVAPVCATVGLLALIKGNTCEWDIISHLNDTSKLQPTELLFLISIGLLIVSLAFFPLVLRQAKKEESWNTTSEMKISSLTPANGEITNYFIGYLFPLLGGELFSNIYISAFFYLSMVLWVSFSGAYNFNPIFTFLGYKFYIAERETNSGKTMGFILIAREIISSPEMPLKMVKMTEHTYLQIKDT